MRKCLIGFILLFFVSWFFSCTKTVTETVTVVDSAAIAPKDTTFKTDVSNWNCYSYLGLGLVTSSAATYTNTSDGIKFLGQGYRLGSRLQLKNEVNIEGRTVYYKWKANGGGLFTSVVLQMKYDPMTSDSSPAIQTVEFAPFCLGSSLSGFTLVNSDVWYYTRVKLTMGSDVAEVTTATGNYDNKGGSVVVKNNINIYTKHGYLALRIGDPYAGTNAYGVLGECKISSN